MVNVYILVQFIKNVAALVAGVLRGAVRSAGAPAGRAAVPRAQHHHTLQLYRQEERPRHTLRVH